MHINVNIFLGTVVALTTVASGCVFGSGKTCIFKCHCGNNDTCDATTEQCPGQCEVGSPQPLLNITLFDWRGPGCQIGNVAHGKLPVQSPRVIGPATYAVDGSLNTCLLTRGNFWWRVNLGSVHVVHSVTLFGFLGPVESNICVGNSTNMTEHTMCATSDSCTDQGRSFTCNSTLYGRYVSLRMNFRRFRTQICEFVVMGYKQTQAECTNCAGVCDDVLGCTECRPEYTKAPLCSKATSTTQKMSVVPSQNILVMPDTTAGVGDIFGSRSDPSAAIIVLAILLGLSIVGNAVLVVYYLKNRYAKKSSSEEIQRNNTQEFPSTGEYEGLQGDKRQYVSSQYAMMRMQTDDAGYEEVTQAGTVDPEYDQI